MKISIITPCFNSEEYIDKTIESVISQEGDFEIQYIIVDGNSTDKTLDIIKKYKNIIDNNLFEKKCKKITFDYISEKDNSMYEALAKGIKKINGELTAYINSDDIYFPNAFKCIFNIFKDEKINWLTGRNSIINADGILVESFLPFRYKRIFINKGVYGTVLPSIQQESTIWRSELNELIDLKQLCKYKLAGDAYIWKCFSEKFELNIVQAGIACFRMRSNQLSASGEYRKEFDLIYEKQNLNKIKSIFEKILWKMPNKVKLNLNKNIIKLNLRGNI